MDDDATLAVEPHVIDHLKPKSRKRKSLIDSSDSSQSDYGTHYNSTNRWILVVFAIIVVLLVGVIVFLIMKDNKPKEDKDDTQRPPPQRAPHSQQRHQPQHSHQQSPQQLQHSHQQSPQQPEGWVQYPSQMQYSQSQGAPVQQPSMSHRKFASPLQQQPIPQPGVAPSRQSHSNITEESTDENLSDMVQRLSNTDSQEEMRKRLVNEIKGGD